MTPLRLAGIALTLFVASWCAPLARAQHNDDNNAATYYRRAFEALQSLSDEDQLLISDYADIDGPPLTPQVQAALNRLAPALRLVHQGAGQDFIDWGTTFEAGPGTMLPHLNSTRQIMKILVADAKASFATGDTRGASNSLAAAYRLSDHSTQGGVVISTLVGASIFRYTNQLVDQAIGEGQFDMAEARNLLESMNSIINDDPFGFAGSIEGERLGMAQWLIDNFGGEGGKDALVDQYEDFFGSFGVDSTLLAISEMSQEDFNSSLYSYDQALVELGGALEHEDLGLALSTAEQLIEDAQNGMFGPMAILMMPALDRAIESMIDLYGQMDDTMAALEGIALDPEGAAAQRNSALWYLRAIALHHTIDDVTWELLESPEQVGLAENRSLVEAIVDSAEPIRRLLHEAVEIRRCNFDLRHRWDRQGPTADLSHTGGMVRNALLLRAELMLALDREPGQQGVDAVGQSATDGKDEKEKLPLLLVDDCATAIVRMSNHLGTDRRMKSTCAAAQVVGVLHDAIDAALQTGHLAPAVAAELDTTLDGAVDPYPLGYTVGLRLYRDLTTGWLIDHFVELGGERPTVMQELAQEASQSKEPVSLHLEPMPYDQALQLIRKMDRRMQQTLTIVADLPVEMVPTTVREQFSFDQNPDLAHWMIDPLVLAAQSLAALEGRHKRVTERLRIQATEADESPPTPNSLNG